MSNNSTKPIEIPVDSAIRDANMKRHLFSETSQTASDDHLTVCILASGSKGNAIFVSNGATSILIDAGLSGIEIERRLKSRGLSPENLDAILVSHEHHDHIQGVGVLSRRFNLPVYMNPRTREAAVSHLGNVYEVKNFECGSKFTVKDLAIHPFAISHDAEDPSGFTIHQDGIKIGIATDLGIATSMVKEHLKDSTLLVLEANHDEKMLINGPYPWPIKQRIKSRIGHLSNLASKHLLNEIQHDRLKYVMLAHLSETNNTPQKAVNEIGRALTRCKARLDVASQDKCGLFLRIK